MNTTDRQLRTSDLRSRSPSSHAARDLLRHFLEMVIAMIVGMVVFGAIVWGIFGLFGHSDLRHYAGLRAFIMVANMIVGMSLWMRLRRHSWAAIGEMAGAMFVPYAVLIGPFWAGALSGSALLVAIHILMLPLMIVAMLHRREEYAAGHASGERPRAGSQDGD